MKPLLMMVLYSRTIVISNFRAAKNTGLVFLKAHYLKSVSALSQAVHKLWLSFNYNFAKLHLNILQKYNHNFLL